MKDTSQSGYGPRAVGDGVANDTAAIQQHLFAAMYGAGGGVVFLPAGTYKVQSTIVVPTGVSLVCGGNARIGSSGNWNTGMAGSATLLAAPGFTGTIMETSGSGTTISNLRIAGTSATMDRPSVHFKPGNNGGRVHVENCAFWRRGREAVRWAVTGEFVCNFIFGHRDAGCIGLYIAAVDSKITGNEVSADGDCVRVEFGANANIISENTIFNSAKGAGIRTFSSRCVYTGNRLDENAGPGLQVEGPGNVVTGNAILLNGVLGGFGGQPVGVHLLQGNGNAVTGNYFGNWCHGEICNTQQYGVAITGSCAHNAVVGNTFTDQIHGGVHNTSSGAGNVVMANAGQV